MKESGYSNIFHLRDVTRKWFSDSWHLHILSDTTHLLFQVGKLTSTEICWWDMCNKTGLLRKSLHCNYTFYSLKHIYCVLLPDPFCYAASIDPKRPQNTNGPLNWPYKNQTTVITLMGEFTQNSPFPFSESVKTIHITHFLSWSSFLNSQISHHKWIHPWKVR